MVVGVAVVSVELRGDGGGVPHQQEDEAHSCHFGARERFARCHLQKVGIALITCLDGVLKETTTGEN